MSALGQKQTLRHLQPMSALPRKADIAERDRHVRFVPIADIQEFATRIRLNPDYDTADCWLYNAAQWHSV